MRILLTDKIMIVITIILSMLMLIISVGFLYSMSKTINKNNVVTQSVEHVAEITTPSDVRLSTGTKPTDEPPVVWKYYDPTEHMLCYQNTLGGMACIWKMDDI